MPLKGLIFDADGQPMCPTLAHGKRGQTYRYYVSANLQQGARRSPDDDAIRRVPAEAVEDLALDKLRQLIRGRAGQTLNWTSALKLLRRVEIHGAAVHLQLQGHELFGAHADLEIEVAQLGRRLGASERAMLDQNNPAMLRTYCRSD